MNTLQDKLNELKLKHQANTTPYIAELEELVKDLDETCSRLASSRKYWKENAREWKAKFKALRSQTGWSKNLEDARELYSKADTNFHKLRNIKRELNELFKRFREV